jgi:hypothetical protein
MERRGKPVKRKVQGKRSTARSARKNGNARDLQKQLADVLGQLRTRDRELGEALERQTATSESRLDLPIHAAVGRHGSRQVNPH